MPETADLVVIGSGAAGMMAAAAAGDSVETLLVTDGPLGRSNTVMAQGGLQLPLPGEESRARFVDDVLRSARVPVDRARVDRFVARVAGTVALLEDWGLRFDRDPSGELVRRTAGGLSEPRVLSAGDTIGPVIVKVLRERVQASRAELCEHTQVVGLVADGGSLRLQLRGRGGERELRARMIVCCTGGVTYREAQRRGQVTTNPPNHNHVLGDALLALGLPQVHADEFQYQPFGLVQVGGRPPGRCIPESIVTEKPRLLDRRGRPVGKVGQDRLALTGAMFAAAEGGDGLDAGDGRVGFRLTLSDVPADRLRVAFPKAAATLERHGLLGEDVLVFPFLHYQLGGFEVGAGGRTAVPGLRLAGEMVGGLHGRNRLMGNGLTDSLVHGLEAAEAAVADLGVRRPG